MKRRTRGRKPAKLRGSRQAVRSKLARPEDLEEFLAMPKRYQELWGDIGQIVTDVREGKTLAEASGQFHRDPRTVRRLAGPALRKQRNGRWAATKHDRLLRVLQLPTPEGRVEIALRDSRQASLLGKFWTAVERYRDTGDASALREFKGKRIVNASGKSIPLLTDLKELDRLGSAGVLSFESLYASVA
jgi:hypothetical protein